MVMLKAISSVVLGHVADKTPFPIDAPMFSLCARVRQFSPRELTRQGAYLCNLRMWDRGREPAVPPLIWRKRSLHNNLRALTR